MTIFLEGCRINDLEYRPEETQLQRLSRWANIYGDFKVTYSHRDAEGIHHFSKHLSVLECLRTDWGIKFLEKANHRQIQPVEYVLDLDDKPTIKQFNKICDFLDQMGEIYYGFFTGSKGYHIHIFNYDLIKENSKKLLRIALATKFKGDLLKTSENVMIAMEFQPHWKTGKKKELLRYG